MIDPVSRAESVSVTTTTKDGLQVKMTPQQLAVLTSEVNAGRKKFFTQAWLDGYTDRFKIVDTCPICKEPLIQEERFEHGVKHIDSKLRPIYRMYQDLNDEDRLAIRDLIAAS